MRTKKAIIACLAVAICLSSFLSAGCGKKGWVTTEEGTFYYEHGEAYTGMKVMPDGTVRYFDPVTFAMATGEQEIDGNKYLFNSDGVMQTGFQTIDGVARYYNPETGILMTGWLEIGQTASRKVKSDLPQSIQQKMGVLNDFCVKSGQNCTKTAVMDGF